MYFESSFRLTWRHLLVIVLAALCVPNYVVAQDNVTVEVITEQPVGVENGSNVAVDEPLADVEDMNCSKFISTWDHDDLPLELQTIVGDPADQPTDVQVEYYRGDSTDGSNNFLQISWKYPPHPHRAAKVFLIYVHRLKENTIQCFVENNDPNAQGLDEIHTFYPPGQVEPGVDAAVYVVGVPLPLKKPELPDAHIVLLKLGDLKHDSNNKNTIESWSPNVAIRSLNVSTVEVAYTGSLQFVEGGEYEIMVRKFNSDMSPGEVVSYNHRCATTGTCIHTIDFIGGDLKFEVSAKDNACKHVCTATTTEHYKMHTYHQTTRIIDRASSVGEVTLFPFNSIITELSTTSESKNPHQEMTPPRRHTTPFLPSSTPQSNGLTTDEATMIAPIGGRVSRPQNARDGGLIGAIVAAALFTVLVVVMSALDRKKPKKPHKKQPVQQEP